jgi:hypothetical protein
MIRSTAIRLLPALAIMASAMIAPPSHAAGLADGVIAEARQSCEGFENGKFDAGDAVQQADLDGDGTPDTVIDESKFSCSTAASLYCGTGGCMLHTIVGDTKRAFQVEGWRMIDWDGRPILLLARDGGWCGGAGAQLCFQAIYWSMGDMLTMGDKGE